MWGWLASILDFLSNVKETVQDIPNRIIDGIKKDFDKLSNLLTNIWNDFTEQIELLTELPNKIYDNFKQKLIDLRNRLDKILTFFTSKEDGDVSLYNIIKSVFVPEPEVVKSQMVGLVEDISHTFNLTIDSDQWLVDSFTEEAIPDEKGQYHISGVGTLELTFFDTSFLKRGIEFFRPIIRGFIVLLLAFYHYRQVLTFIGQDPNIYSNAHSTYMEHKGGGKE